MVQRLLLLDNGREWGGGTNSLLALLARLDRARHAVDAVFYHDYAGGPLGQLSRSLAALRCRWPFSPQRRQPLWAKLGKELARGVLTHCPAGAPPPSSRSNWPGGCAPTPNSWPRGAIGRLSGAVYEQPAAAIQSGRLSGRPTGRRAGDSALPQQSGAVAARAVAAANQAARIIAVSHGIADSLRAQGVDPARIRVVPNGIDPTQPCPTRPPAAPGWACRPTPW